MTPTAAGTDALRYARAMRGWDGRSSGGQLTVKPRRTVASVQFSNSPRDRLAGFLLLTADQCIDRRLRAANGTRDGGLTHWETVQLFEESFQRARVHGTAFYRYSDWPSIANPIIAAPMVRP